MTPAATLAPTARRRKYSTMSSSANRRASQMRNTAARYAHTATASTPPRIEVGLIQLVQGSPALPPAGTCPEAMEPATAPMQYGTTTEEIANNPPKIRRHFVRFTSLRNAKLEPRSTIPNAASESGTYNVSVIDANASGN